jgi:hypothetical protein
MEALVYLLGAVALVIAMAAFIRWSERRDMKAAIRETNLILGLPLRPRGPDASAQNPRRSASK